MNVITLQNGKKLNELQFISYFEKKVFYTIRKYSMFQDINNENKFKIKVKDLFSIKKIDKTYVSQDCLDDIALEVLKVFMSKQDIKNNIKRLLPSIFISKKKIIKPFYFISKKEIEIYARLKKIKFKSEKKKDRIARWLDEFELTHLEVKNAIVNSLLSIEEN